MGLTFHGQKKMHIKAKIVLEKKAEVQALNE